MAGASETGWQSATVVDILSRTPTIKSFVLELPRAFRFTPGQHVDIRLSAPDGYQAVRSYSIAGVPEKHSIEVAVELLPAGEVSPYFHEVVELGDEIELRGPLGGHFVWSPPDGGPLLLVGGGSGVVPLVAMVRRRRELGSTVPALLLVSAKTREDVLFRDELQATMQDGDGFTLVITLTGGAPAGSGDFQRRVDGEMMENVLSRLRQKPRFVFICGNNPFVNAAADGAIAAGVPSETIRTERYGA
jgi:ferredoxin-NADP reductase